MAAANLGGKINPMGVVVGKGPKRLCGSEEARRKRRREGFRLQTGAMEWNPERS